MNLLKSFDIYEEIKLYFADSPEYLYLIVAGILGLFFWALVKDYEWPLTPTSSADLTPLWIELFGRGPVRFFMALLTLLGIIGCLVSFWIVHNES